MQETNSADQMEFVKQEKRRLLFYMQTGLLCIESVTAATRYDITQLRA